MPTRKLGLTAILLTGVLCAYLLAGVAGGLAGAGFFSRLQQDCVVPAWMSLQDMLGDGSLADGPLAQPHFAVVGILFAINGLALIALSAAGARWTRGVLLTPLLRLRPERAYDVLWALVLVPLAMACSFAIIYWLAGIRLPAERGIDFAAWQSWLYLVALIVLAPLAEEIAFRGWLLSGLDALWSSPALAIVISALFWALIHLSQGGAKTIALVPVGLLLGWLRHRSGSLLPGLAGHVTMNAMGLTIMILMAEGQ